jgi:hypothetical protein
VTETQRDSRERERERERERRDWEKEGDRKRNGEENLRMRDLFGSCSSTGRERETQERVKNI